MTAGPRKGPSRLTQQRHAYGEVAVQTRPKDPDRCLEAEGADLYLSLKLMAPSSDTIPPVRGGRLLNNPSPESPHGPTAHGLILYDSLQTHQNADCRRNLS
jgi:hypothetical protein